MHNPVGKEKRLFREIGATAAHLNIVPFCPTPVGHCKLLYIGDLTSILAYCPTVGQMPVNGTNGTNGTDGTDGTVGTDGTDGTDGTVRKGFYRIASGRPTTDPTPA